MAKKIYQLRVWSGTEWETIQISAEVEQKVEQALNYAAEVNNGVFNLSTPVDSIELNFTNKEYGSETPIYQSIYPLIKNKNNTSIWGKPAALVVSVAFDNGMYWSNALLLFLGWNNNGSGDTFYSKVQVIPLKSQEDAYCFAYADFKINSSALTLSNVNIRLAPLLDSSNNNIIPSRFLPSYVDDVQDLFTITEDTDQSHWSLATNSNALIACKTADGTLLYKYSNNAWTSIGAPEKDKIYVCLHSTLTPTHSNQATIYRWSGSALVQIIDLTSIVADLSNTVKKVSENSQVYATDQHGEQITIPWSTEVSEGSIMRRTASGTVSVNTDDSDRTGLQAANTGYVKHYAQSLIDSIKIRIDEVQ